MKEMADPKLARLLREYAEELRAVPPPPNVEAALLAVLEESRVARKRSGSLWWWGAVAGAAAAACLAVVMLRPSPVAAPAPTAPPAVVAVAEAPNPASVQPASVQAAPVQAAPVVAQRPRAISRNSRPVARELVSEFVPLAENEFLPAPRQAQVYRVSVPRSTLASLGFPVEDELRPDSRLTADVLMDQDGLARAVRLVKTVY